MLLNSEQSLLIAFAFVWLLALSYFVFKVSGRFRKLTGGTVGDISLVLEKIINEQKKTGNQIKKLEDELKSLEQESLLHIQRVGLVRFNPFSETGGDQSFALALLDRFDTGIVMLSLHGREGTRLYVKPVKLNKSTYELSKEEKQAIEEAKKTNKLEK